jgi:Putative phage holin Dp-1
VESTSKQAKKFPGETSGETKEKNMTTITPITDTTPDDAPKAIILSQSAYNVIKDVDLIVIPALGTAYVSLSGVWGLPFVPQVLGTAAVVVFLIGILLKISNVQFTAATKVAVAKAVSAAVVSAQDNQSAAPVIVDPTTSGSPVATPVLIQPTPTYVAPTDVLTGQSVAGGASTVLNISPETPGTVSQN